MVIKKDQSPHQTVWSRHLLAQIVSEQDLSIFHVMATLPVLRHKYRASPNKVSFWIFLQIWSEYPYRPFWLFWASLNQICHFGTFWASWAIMGHWGHLGAILGHFGPFGHSGPFGLFWFIWAILDHFGPFWAIWAILGHLGHSGPFWAILGHQGQFGPFGIFGPFWAILGHLGHFCHSGPFWAVWAILDHFHGCQQGLKNITRSNFCLKQCSRYRILPSWLCAEICCNRGKKGLSGRIRTFSGLILEQIGTFCRYLHQNAELLKIMRKLDNPISRHEKFTERLNHSAAANIPIT